MYPQLKEFIRYLLLLVHVRPSKKHWTIFAYGSSGDVYLTCSLVKAFKEKFKQNVHVVVPPHMIILAEMFRDSIDKIIPYKLSWHPINKYLQSKSSIDKKIVYAHPDGNFDHNIFRFLMGYKKLSLMDIIKLTLNLHPMVAEEKPKISIEAYKKVEEIFQTLDLKENKTVLIAPFAQTATSLSEDFWRQLICKLQQYGYSVIVNNCNDNIKLGAQNIFLSYELIIPFVNKCGYFVSLRSGLCDILTTSTAKKISIYPNKEFYDLYSITECWNNRNFVDITYDDNILTKILEEFCNV